jgi:hypothetical protein
MATRLGPRSIPPGRGAAAVDVSEPAGPASGLSLPLLFVQAARSAPIASVIPILVMRRWYARAPRLTMPLSLTTGPEEMRLLDGLDEGLHTGWDPTDAP